MFLLFFHFLLLALSGLRFLVVLVSFGVSGVFWCCGCTLHGSDGNVFPQPGSVASDSFIHARKPLSSGKDPLRPREAGV